MPSKGDDLGGTNLWYKHIHADGSVSFECAFNRGKYLYMIGSHAILSDIVPENYFGSGRFLLRDGPLEFTGEECSIARRIRITEFCITGDDDYGDHAEHKLLLNNRQYYPRGNDCGGDDFCVFRENHCTDLLAKTKWESRIDTRETRKLRLGTEEEDTFSNDFTRVELDKYDWFSDVCGQYKIGVAMPFGSTNSDQRRICWSGAQPIHREFFGLPDNLVHCDEWKLLGKAPKDHYIWYFQVQPSHHY